MMGVLKIGMLYSEKRMQTSGKPAGFFGAMLVGVAFAFGWTPCIGPILAAILAVAATQDSVGEGVKLLAVFTHGPGQMFNTKRPITKVEDLAGMKIRTGGGIAEEMARALGASAFVKPAPESYELLKGGVADGVFFPMESIVSFKLETVIEQATLFPGGMYSSAFGFFMNEDKWNKLPKQDQEAIEKLSGEHIARLAGNSWDEADRKGMEALKKSGVKIVEANPAFVAEVKKRSAPIIEDWITKANAKGLDAAKILTEFREELKKVAGGK